MFLSTRAVISESNFDFSAQHESGTNRNILTNQHISIVCLLLLKTTHTHHTHHTHVESPYLTEMTHVETSVVQLVQQLVELMIDHQHLCLLARVCRNFEQQPTQRSSTSRSQNEESRTNERTNEKPVMRSVGKNEAISAAKFGIDFSYRQLVACAHPIDATTHKEIYVNK
jgi:hypothetical protein